MKTVRRQAKTIRLVEQDVLLLKSLNAVLYQYSTEADVLTDAARIGMLVLSATALQSGEELDRFDSHTIAARLRVALLPALDLMVQERTLPAMLGAVSPAPGSESPSPPGPETGVGATIARDLAGLGSGFLDDDDDE